MAKVREVQKDRVTVLQRSLEAYLSSVFGGEVEVVHIGELGEEKKREVWKKAEGDDLKGFGYGVPYLIVCSVGGRTKRIVLETMHTVGGFGHDHFSDRAGVLLWQHSAFNKLHNHVNSFDVGAFTTKHGLQSLGDCTEFFVLTDFVEGTLYHNDLDRLKMVHKLESIDLERCRALSDYLARIHTLKRKQPGLYVRRVRDLVGHGECIMGLMDSYPENVDYMREEELVNVEKLCVDWRWKLKHFTHRLAQVHGDFHPWNVLFRKNADFTVLDRSRGEWGEPADDVSAMTINYIFYSLQTHGCLARSFERIFNLFWENYLGKTSDEEMLEVIAPFFAWRSLVVASPIWYPNLSAGVRTMLFNFIRNVLRAERFELKDVNSYFKP